MTPRLTDVATAAASILAVVVEAEKGDTGHRETNTEILHSEYRIHCRGHLLVCAHCSSNRTNSEYREYNLGSSACSNNQHSRGAEQRTTAISRLRFVFHSDGNDPTVKTQLKSNFAVTCGPTITFIRWTVARMKRDETRQYVSTTSEDIIILVRISSTGGVSF
ncbi:hypothetical protein CBL_01952 [Carabus blaptoides fortunei]